MNDSKGQPSSWTLFRQSMQVCFTMILPLDFFWHFPEWLRRMNSPAVNYSVAWCLQKWNPRRSCLTQVPSVAQRCSECCEMYLDMNQAMQTNFRMTWALKDDACSVELHMTACVDMMYRWCAECMASLLLSLKMDDNSELPYFSLTASAIEIKQHCIWWLLVIC